MHLAHPPGHIATIRGDRLAVDTLTRLGLGGWGQEAGSGGGVTRGQEAGSGGRVTRGQDVLTFSICESVLCRCDRLLMF